MRTLATTAEAFELRKSCAAPVVLVPTMGALHVGHTALIDAARTRAGQDGTVVVSIFVNPTQFGPREDFASYPRPLEADLTLCAAHGADAVFAPLAKEIYPPGNSTIVEETMLSRGLCGAVRPGHFRGVCTVVAKLFGIWRPDVAVFGEKDYQQLAIIRRMTRDLFFGVEILGHPIVREADGLAASSRNKYLSNTERARARYFPAALAEAAQKRIPEEIVTVAVTRITEGTGSAPDYVAALDAETLEPAVPGRPAVLAAAVKIGETRLLDNIRLERIHGKI